MTPSYLSRPAQKIIAHQPPRPIVTFCSNPMDKPLAFSLKPRQLTLISHILPVMIIGTILFWLKDVQGTTLAKQTSKKGVHSPVAVAEIARIMGRSYEDAEKFCASVRKYAKAKTTTDGQIYKCIRYRKAAWSPRSVARYTDGSAERIRRKVGSYSSKAAKSSKNLYSRQYYIYRNSSQRATVHFSDCAFCNYGRGSTRTTTRSWFGPYDSRRSAMTEAKNVAKTVHLCDHCGGALAVEDVLPDIND